MRGGGRLGWRLLVAVAIAAGWWTVATDATLIDDARHAWAFMTVVGVVAGIPGLLVIKALVREVPLLLLAVAVFVGAGPVVACVRALGPVYQLQGPVSIGVLLLHAAGMARRSARPSVSGSRSPRSRPTPPARGRVTRR